jgi:hypothetical protein
LLAGCGASQPPVGAPGAMPQSSAIATHAAHGTSWMLPEALTEDLLYISSDGRGSVYVYSYPRGGLVGVLSPNTSAAGACTDSAGDVFVTTVNQNGSSTIYEYAHGGTIPIESLSDQGGAEGCAVDTETGDLAVTNAADLNNPYYRYHGDLAIYTRAQGSPTMYYPKEPIRGFYFCGYDNNSNLYLSGEDDYHGGADLVRLSNGSTSFELISLNKKLFGSSVQWDGRNMTVSSTTLLGRQPLLIYRLRISGSTASVIGTTVLDSGKNVYNGQVWIQGKTVIALGPYKRGYQNAFFWAYPAGGNDRRAINKVGGLKQTLWGVTVSLAPH